MKFEIKHCVTGAVLFALETESTKLCVESAVKAHVNLSGANLSDADLSDANLCDANLRDAYLSDAYLRGANLRGADLRDANLRGADLSDANLRDANLRGAYLRDANLSDADLSDAYLRDANLRDAYLSDAYLSGVPKIKNIDAQILAAIESGGTLEMRDWHTCDTTHCRAGWAVHLAGEGGAALEWAIGTPTAATLIYLASRPDQRIPDFYCDNETAMADIRKCAAEQLAAEA
jgi:uncharacterized protein YjbI with pentapeptide repeats